MLGPRTARSADLALAHSRQTALASGCDVSVWMLPAGGALDGGDWCDLFERAPDDHVVTIGDVEGHGAAVAGLMQRMRRSVLHAAGRVVSPSDVLAIANATAARTETLVTSILARIDLHHRRVTFANAGHPAPLLVTANETRYLESLRKTLPLGVAAALDIADRVVHLASDAVLVFYTDGVTEHERDPIRGEWQLAQAARTVFERAEDDVARGIAEVMFDGGASHDDAAIAAIRFR